MSDIEDDKPPKTLLTIPTQYQSEIHTTSSSGIKMAGTDVTPPLFDSNAKEIHFRKLVASNCPRYDGNTGELSTWLEDVNSYFTNEGLTDPYQVLAIRILLTGDALNYYLAHEDLVHNFHDLRKLLLHKTGTLQILRDLSSLDSISSLSISMVKPTAESTLLTANTTTTTNTKDPSHLTNITLSQSIEDLTQNDYRKTIIETLLNKSPKFTGDQKQDVVEWLKQLDTKFQTAGIPDPKKFDVISLLLDKGALDWFIERQERLNHSWSDFVEQLTKTFDSPNRSRLAKQKLLAYSQSPNQDIRSFCSEMRKLFKDSDPEMSNNFKLELLISKVNSSYRKDILTAKPIDPDEFEVKAQEIENNYLILQAIEKNSFSSPDTAPSYPLLSTSPRYNSPLRPHFSNSNYTNNTQQPPSHPPNNQRFFHRNRNGDQYRNSPYSNPPYNSFRYPRQFQQYSNYQRFTPSDRSNPQHNLFTYAQSSTEQALPSLPSQQQVPQPLMQQNSTSSQPQPQQQPSCSPQLPVCCQWCNQSGHSARDCPF